MRLRYFATLTLALSVPQIALAQTAPVASEAIDPARLEAAQHVVVRILPDGTYAKIMEASMGAMMQTVTDSVGDLPLSQLARMGGLDDEAVAEMGPGTLKELMAIVDPVFDQRTALMTKSMANSMTKMMASMEPSVREGLKRAFARRYSLEQLNDLNRFFDTPTGQKFAGDTMLIYVDPEVIAAMQAMMPKIMEQMPAMMQDIQAELATLPKPREWSELSKPEREKFAKLLGTTVADIEASRAERGDSN